MVARDIPLNEITLRKYERPYSGDKREIMKKTCLSMGLLQAGDSRDVIVDVMMVLLDARKHKDRMSSDEIKKRVEMMREKHNLEMKGIAESNIRRQLKRLRDLMIVDKKENMYHLSEHESLSHIFEHKIEKFILAQTISRVKEYLEELERENDVKGGLGELEGEGENE